MQFKFIAASIAALSVGSAIAGPLPVPVQDNGFIAREAAPVAQPAPEPIKARAEQAIQAEQLTQIQQEAHRWADLQGGLIPNQQQLTFAQNYFPQQAWNQNYYGINNWNQGWDPNIYYYYYLYFYYQNYNWQWNQYWPNWNTNWNQGWCTPGWC